MAKGSRHETSRQKYSVKDEIGQKLLSLMPGLQGRLFKVFKEIERFDGRNATTLISRMEAVAEGYVPKPTGRESQIVEKIPRLLKHPALGQEIRAELNDVIRFLKREAFQDRRASLLLKLISAADARITAHFVSILA